MKTRIPLKRYVMDESLSWEERYEQLERHHLEEAQFLIRRIEELEQELEARNQGHAPQGDGHADR